MNKPTARQATRIEQGIREHVALLLKELAISDDLRNHAYVNRLNASIAKLENMLATGAGLPVFDPRIDGYNVEFLGAKPAKACQDY